MPGGRPKGSKNKISFKSHLSNKEIEKLVNLAKKRAETDGSILKFLLEQIFGRAVQTLASSQDEPFKLQIVRDKSISNADKNDKTS